MGFVLQQDETIAKAVPRVAREQIERALSEIGDDDLEEAEVVHQVRKRCKKVRGLLRLVRGSFEPDFSDANHHFRDTARLLSDRRDADTRLATFDALGDEEPALRGEPGLAIREALVEEREQSRSGGTDALLREVSERLREGHERTDEWHLQDSGFDAMRAGLEKTYRRGCRAMEAAIRDPSPPAFHEWRKHVKYHGYHVRLLRRSWKDVLQPQRKAVEELADLLGLDHDLAVLREHLTKDPERFPRGSATSGALLAIDRRRSNLAAHVRSLGRRVHAERPSALSRRFCRYWRAWHAERGPRLVRAVGA